MIHHAQILEILNRQLYKFFSIAEIEHKLDLQRRSEDPEIVASQVQEELDYLVASQLVRLLPSAYRLSDAWCELSSEHQAIWLCTGTAYRPRPELDHPQYFPRTTPSEYAWEALNWWSFELCVVRPGSESNVAIVNGLVQGGFVSIVDIKRRISDSLSTWYQTPAGAVAWDNSVADFNIGDLDPDDDLTELLRQNGIRHLIIKDAVASSDWQYDDILGTPPALTADFDAGPDPDLSPTIAQLNDECRVNLGIKEIPNCRVVVKQSIANLPTKDHDAILTAIRNQDDFDPEDDPYSRHDFGAITTSWGAWVFWKFDYFDLDMDGGSQNPADPAITLRVLTIMLSEEY